MQRDREYLLDILEAAKLALAYVSGKMRNRIIHEYNDVDWFIVWDTVLKDLPLLVDAIERFVSFGQET